ncbi:MAG: ABC transporter permease, partial [Fulvivirga sp.]|uniref:ABC transporter permease n=1 Tax=Fulvivirga sp. TaxID=1931237 RepID=UPI0032ED378D
MLQHNLKIAIRSLFRNKLFSTINILGLALGFLTCLLIGQYVSFELSYDRFHKNADRIYRVRHDRYINGELQYKKAQAFIPTGEVLKKELPEVLAYTTLFRVSEQHDVIMSYLPKEGKTIRFAEDNVYKAKGKFREVFSLDILEGSTELEMLEPHTMLIAESVANKYFGDQSAIGKSLSDPNLKSYEIVGVFKDLPKNSHFHIDFLLGWDTISGDENYDHSNWRWDAFYTYLLLTPRANPDTLEANFSGITDKYMGDQNNNTYSKLVLQPIADIHLHSNLIGEIEPNGDANIINALTGLAIFILLIAWINYINLSTSHSLDRSGEIGIRKAVGSTRKQIIKQFLTETLLTNLLAILTSIIILLVLSFTTFSHFEISLELFKKVEFWVMVLFILIAGSLFAGLYP